jgi:hypothetical protein
VPPGGTLAGAFRSEGGAGGGGLAPNAGLDFCTTTGAVTDDAPWGDVQEVNYQLVSPPDRNRALGRDLVRGITRNLLTIAPQEPVVQRLLSDVESVEFLYFDGTEWLTTWDTTLGDAGLPLAVRARILLATRDTGSARTRQPVELVVPLGIQSGTNQTQTASSSTGGQL